MKLKNLKRGGHTLTLVVSLLLLGICALQLQSCRVYPPSVIWNYGDEIGESIYTEMGIIDVNRIHVALTTYNDIGGGYASVSDGKTIGIKPVIIDVTKGGIFITFHSNLALIRYFEAHGWYFEGFLLLNSGKYINSVLVFSR